MASLPVYDMAGKEVGTYEIDSKDVAPLINKKLLHDAVVMYQANLRQGSHSAKPRSRVAGSTKKMYRQKGTGNARAGSRRSNIRRGGGVGHTIEPRDYSYRLTKKAVKLATRMAIASKIADNELVVVENLALDAIKTKVVAGALKSLGLDGVTTLIVTDQADQTVYMSSRNLEGVSVSPVRELNALSVLKPRRMLVTKAALDRIKDGSFAASAAAV